MASYYTGIIYWNKGILLPYLFLSIVVIIFWGFLFIYLFIIYINTTYQRVLVVDVSSVFEELVDDIDVAFGRGPLQRSGRRL
jgi:hypothetical protein